MSTETFHLPDSNSFPFTPIPPAASPDAVCSVHTFITGRITCPGKIFVENATEMIKVPALSFFIQHRTTGQKLVFDLGVKTDLERYPPIMKEGFLRMVETEVPRRSTAQQLADGGVDLKSIQSVVYSHAHWDHVGDVHHFDPSTELIVGPGTRAAVLPGFPIDSKSNFAHGDIDPNRPVRELHDKLFDLAIGCFRGHDFWGDGSLYFLDGQGHMFGQILALVRVRSAPDVFVLLSADAAHHRALFSCCIEHGHHAVVGSFTIPGSDAIRTMHVDTSEALRTMSKLARMEQEENVFIIPAHDTMYEDWLLRREDGLWKSISERGWDLANWRESGVKEEIYETTRRAAAKSH